jgi:hypothetical protein
MLDAVNKILELPHVARYRKYLLSAAVALLMLHVMAFVLLLALPDSKRAQHLVNLSYNLHGVTLGLLLVVVLGAAVRALTDADKLGRSDVYSFIRKTLTGWFAASMPEAEAEALTEEIISESYTDFKVRGAERLIGPAGRGTAERFCKEVHFEFTFYPTKLIYGIHFESPRRDVNESMLAEVRGALLLDEESGFAVDHQIPKKPAWIFFIRTVEIPGQFEDAKPTIMTHARHFAELVFHSHNIVYSDAMAERFQGLSAEPQIVGRSS